MSGSEETPNQCLHQSRGSPPLNGASPARTPAAFRDMGIQWPSAPKRRKVLPQDRASSRQIAQAQVGRRLGLGLRGGIAPISGDQRFAQPEFNCRQPDNCQREREGANVRDVACNAVCFHDSRLTLKTWKGLIERNYTAIDGSDGRRESADYDDANAQRSSAAKPAVAKRPCCGKHVRMEMKRIKTMGEPTPNAIEI